MPSARGARYNPAVAGCGPYVNPGQAPKEASHLKILKGTAARGTHKVELLLGLPRKAGGVCRSDGREGKKRAAKGPTRAPEPSV